MVILRVIRFQFHYGSIKMGLGVRGKNNLRGFNSTMVRLKYNKIRQLAIQLGFQFHYGSIKIVSGSIENGKAH